MSANRVSSLLPKQLRQAQPPSHNLLIFFLAHSWYEAISQIRDPIISSRKTPLSYSLLPMPLDDLTYLVFRRRLSLYEQPQNLHVFLVALRAGFETQHQERIRANLHMLNLPGLHDQVLQAFPIQHYDAMPSSASDRGWCELADEERAFDSGFFLPSAGGLHGIELSGGGVADYVFEGGDIAANDGEVDLCWSACWKRGYFDGFSVVV